MDEVSVLDDVGAAEGLRILLNEHEVEVRIRRYFGRDGVRDGLEAEAWSEDVVRPRHVGTGWGSTLADTLQDLIENVEGLDGDSAA